MFGFLYELMGGQHGELPRRRADPTIEYDRDAGGFVSADGADLGGEWLGRGEVPGQRARDATAALERAGQTLADEMREFAQPPRLR